jgi:hypothetical protein
MRVLDSEIRMMFPLCSMVAQRTFGNPVGTLGENLNRAIVG